jgi:NADH-quinone oxidoreductase subunit N
MPETLLSDLARLGPEMALVATVVAVVAGDLLMRTDPRRYRMLTLIASSGLLVAALLIPVAPEVTGTSDSIFSGMLAFDGFSIFFKWLFFAAALMGVLFGALSSEIPRRRFGEYLIVLLCLTIGLFLLVSAQNLLMIFIAIELVSLPSYILAGFRHGDRRTSEAALKYVIFGAAASGLMLYGFSLLYGLTGTLALAGIGGAVNAAAASGGIAVQAGIAMAVLLSIVGFGYKVAAVPFHMWCPDVYEGAPTPFTAFLSVAPKAAGIAALLRFLVVGFGVDGALQGADAFPWQTLVGVVAVATMTIGNLSALMQDNIKRMLAYSSIAHAGYMLMGVAVGTPEAMRAVMFYLPVYLLMNMGAFLVVMIVRERTGSESIDAYNGLGTRSSLVAVTMAVFLFSLVGIPPFGGFIAKFYLFLAVIRADTSFFYVLALAAIINTTISLFYYARVVRAMFLEQHQGEMDFGGVDAASTGLVTLLAIPTLLLGVWWAPLAMMVDRTGALLGGF